ncbi:MAG: hypothetical protein ACYC9Y_09595 [Candidatus Methylomirabilia bacterium]
MTPDLVAGLAKTRSMTRDPRPPLQRPLAQYVIGLSVHLLFVLILMNTATSWKNIQLPEGAYRENLFKGTDVMTYVQPARNFLEFGVFGKGLAPDHHRTVGFPLYLALIMKLFGDQWLIGHYFIMAAIAASVYPALSKTLLLLFPGERLSSSAYFLFLLVSGAYFAQLPAVLTDTLFTAFFSAGLYFGLRAAASGSWPSCAAAVLLTGYSAQIRPALAIFPLANLFLQAFVARGHGVLGRRGVQAIIAATFVLSLLAGQLPALRNYAHYGMYQSTDLVGSTLTGYLCRPVLHKAGRDDLFQKMTDDTAAIASIKERVAFQKQFTFEVMKSYPLLTAQVLAKHAVPTLLNNHWIYFGQYWGYHWVAEQPAAHMHMKKSWLMLFLTCVWTLVYLAVTGMFLVFLWRLARNKEWLLLTGVVLLLGVGLVPGLVANSSPRLRLPLEWIIVMGAFRAASATFFRGARPGVGRLDSKSGDGPHGA